MNEAEFESRVAGLLTTIFPSISLLNVSQQRSFSLKFGHHNILINGIDPGMYAKRGIFDVLVSLKELPLVLFELKKPKTKITEEDKKQGVSYARLTETITPLTVISNGTETVILNTFTREEYEETSFDAKTITGLIHHNLKLASGAFEDSVANLFENDRRIIYDVINEISAEKFSQLSGELNEFQKPLIKDFLFDRDMAQFQKLLQNNNHVYITGDRFVGKTTFLYLLYLKARDAGNAFYYSESADPIYSILSKLTNFIIRKLKIAVTDDQLRRWLLINQDPEHDKRLIMAFDHLKISTSQDVKNEIALFSDLFQGTNNVLLLASDTTNYKSICGVNSGAGSGFFAQRFKKHLVLSLSSLEFFNANHLLNKKYESFISLGGENSWQYRSPGVWRLLAIDAHYNRPEWAGYGLVKAVPSTSFLGLLADGYYGDKQVLQDFMKLTEAYVRQLIQSDFAGKDRLMAIHLPLLHQETFCNALDVSAQARLLECGYVEKEISDDLVTVYISKVPELMLRFCIGPLKKALLVAFQTGSQTGYNLLMRVGLYMPSGEIICAKIVHDLCYHGEDLIVGDIFKMLIDNQPSIHVDNNPRTVAMYKPDYGIITFDIKEGVESSFIENPVPFLILSHLVGFAFKTDQNNPHHFNLFCLSEIGSLPFLLRPNPRELLEDLEPEVIDLPNIGSITAPDQGIVEPIVQSIQGLLVDNPQMVKEVFEAAVQFKRYPLVYRIYIAAKNSQYFHMKDTNEVRTFIIDQYTDLRIKILAIADSEAGANRAIIRRLEKDMKKRGAYYSPRLDSIS